MDNLFDDLFNRFFGRKKPKEEVQPETPPENEVEKKEEIKEFIEMIKNMEPIDDDNMGMHLDEELGEPDLVEYYTEDEFYFEKKTWFKFGGELVKIISSSEPLNPDDAKSLEELLDIALSHENYEEAARLRDEINKD